jgi:hypothetical protein
VTGPLRVAWLLTALVVVAGAGLWLTTGRTVFAVFIVLGLLTAAGAWITGRTAPAPAPAERSAPAEDRASAPESTSAEEEQP